VREFSREDERKLCIVFDNPAPGVLGEAEYERAVGLAASLAWHFSEQDAELSFLLPGRPRTKDLHEFLAGLAVIQPSQGARTANGEESGDVLRQLNLASGGEYNILLTARPGSSLPPGLRNCSHIVALGEHPGARQ
jgi:uncharacterized protein (DUF58 family)